MEYTEAQPSYHNSQATGCSARSVVVMFSGGRDSTLATLRLFERGLFPTLVTVTSNHLLGISAVQRRLTELRQHLPGDVRWIQVQQPCLEAPGYDARTCLPCQQAYAVIAAKAARLVGAEYVAMGYVSYQRDWPEQTRLATDALREVLKEHGLELLLPVYDVTSKDEALALLQHHGLSAESLEQKCSRQITNIVLADSELDWQIDAWKHSISTSLARLDEIELKIMADRIIRDI